MDIYLNVMAVLSAKTFSPCLVNQMNSLLIVCASCDVGRPFKEVKTRVKKQYPSVQLSAWMVCDLLSIINIAACL